MNNFGCEAFNTNALNPRFDVIGGVGEAAVGIPLRIVGSRQIWDFDVFDQRWQGAFIKEFFDKLFALLWIEHLSYRIVFKPKNFKKRKILLSKRYHSCKIINKKTISIVTKCEHYTIQIQNFVLSVGGSNDFLFQLSKNYWVECFSLRISKNNSVLDEL